MKQENFVAIQVVTGSGNFPDTGFRPYNVHERLENVLKLAANHLKLQATDGWVVRLGDRELNPGLRLMDIDIPNESRIFWARREPGGGGGHAS